MVTGPTDHTLALFTNAIRSALSMFLPEWIYGLKFFTLISNFFCRDLECYFNVVSIYFVCVVLFIAIFRGYVMINTWCKMFFTSPN